MGSRYSTPSVRVQHNKKQWHEAEISVPAASPLCPRPSCGVSSYQDENLDTEMKTTLLLKEKRFLPRWGVQCGLRLWLFTGFFFICNVFDFMRTWYSRPKHSWHLTCCCCLQTATECFSRSGILLVQVFATMLQEFGQNFNIQTMC